MAQISPAMVEGVIYEFMFKYYQNTSKNGDTKDSSKSRGAEDQRLNHRIDDPTTEHKRQGSTSEG